jgi:hypothetical protein
MTAIDETVDSAAKLPADGLEPVIEISDVWKLHKLGDEVVKALVAAELKVLPGEFVCLMGPSGSPGARPCRGSRLDWFRRMTATKRRESADGVVTRREDPQVVVASLPGSYAPTLIDLRDWPCDARLKVQLADAIEALTEVNGVWKSAQSARQNRDRTEYFARWCGEHDVRELDQLTPVQWNSYLLHLAAKGTKNNTQHRQLVTVRQVLRRYPHRLHPDLPKHLNRRLPKRDADESQPYPKDVYNAILKAAMAAVNAE